MSIPNYLTSRSVNSVQSLVNYSDNSVQVSAASTSDYTTFGQNWTQTSAPNVAWYAISASVNGHYLTACVYGGQIYTSINYGQSWTAVATSQNWTAIAVSNSGQYQVATVANGAIYYSTNYGSTWTASATSGTTALNWSAIAISAAGQYVCAAVNGGAIWYSSNNGLTWTVSNSGTATWTGIAINSVGNYVTACAGLSTAGTSGTGSLYYSNNFGQTWTASVTVGTTALTWTSVAMSASGSIQTASVTGGSIWYSSTYGQTWTVSNASANTWKSMTMSASGLYGLVTTNAISVGATTVNSLLYNYRFNVTDVLGAQLLDFASGIYNAFLVNGASISSSVKQVGTGSLSLTSNNTQFVVLPPFQMTSAVQTSGLTIACWINPNTIDATIFQMSQSNLANGLITGTGTGYTITVTIVNRYIYYYLGSSTSSAFSTIGNYYSNTTIPTNTWTHFALVLVNGSAPTLYINGSAVTFNANTGNTLLPLPTYLSGVYPYIWIGTAAVNTGGYPTYFNGNMDEFRFYTSALTAAQVSAVWNGGSGIVGLLQYSTNMGQTWTSTTGIHANYQAVTMSANGQFLAACVNGGGIFISLVASTAVSTSSSLTVSGATSTGVLTYQDGSSAMSAQTPLDYSTLGAAWTVQPVIAGPSGVWSAVAMSTTGQYIMACLNVGYIWYSSNYGESWLSGGGYSSSGLAFTAIAISATGQYGVAAVNAGSIYYSSNYGVLWTTTGLANSTWTSVAASASGAYMLATAASGYIWYSSNYGTTWTQSGSVLAAWSAIAISASGQYAIAVVNGGYIWMSSNYGVMWVQTGSASYNWSSVAISASGQYVTAAVGVNTSAAAAAGLLFYSANYGATWTQTGSSNFWKTVIMSASGQYQLATTNFPSLLYNYRFATTDIQGAYVLDYATGQYSAQLINGAMISKSTVKVGTGSLSLTATASQYAQLPPFQMKASYTGLTVVGWVNLSAGNAAGARFFELSGALKNGSSQISGSGTAYTYSVAYNSSFIYFVLNGNTSTGQSLSGSYGTPYTLGSWAHIAFVMTSTTWQIYMNGSLITPTIGQAVPAGYYLPPTSYNGGIYPHFFLGRSSWSTDAYATGFWDDFRFYTTALSSTQVAAIYNSNTLGALHYSSNFGQSWQSTTGPQANYSGLAMSSTGQSVMGCLTTGIIYGSVTANGPMVTSGNMTVGGVLTAPVHSYADGSSGITATAQLDYSTFAQNWATVAGLSTNAVWYGCAVSATGQYQTANIASSSGTIWYSWNYGQTWAQATITANQNYGQVFMSASGQYQVCGINTVSTGTIYISSNYGQTWTVVSGSPTGGWFSFCVSASGQYMSGSINSDYTSIYYSTNYGVTWTPATGFYAIYTGMCCSASGQYQSACAQTSNYIYISSNYGQTWTQSGSILAGWQSICCSASGQYQTALTGAGVIYYSSNYGQTWTAAITTVINSNTICCSASGQYQVSGTNGTSAIYYSTNYGQTWSTVTTAFSTIRLAMSADGRYVLGVMLNGAVYQSVIRSPSLFSSGSIILGNSANTQNQPQLVYNQVGAGSTTNYTAAGFLSNANTLCWTANGNVGIGTTNPGQLLTVYNATGATTISMIHPSTNTNYMSIVSNGTTYGFMGCDNSAGSGLFGSGVAYGLWFGTPTTNPLNFATNNVSRMTILSNGNVGIANTTPPSMLAVGNSSISGSNGTIIIGKNSGAGASRMFQIGYDASYNMVIGDIGSNNTIGTWLSQFMIAYTAPANSLVINSSGYVGIGTATPAYALDVYGTSTAGNTYGLQLRNGNGASVTGTSTSPQIVFSYSGTSQSYAHWIATRHNAASPNHQNAIDFYTWSNSQASGTLGSNLAMSITSSGVGIGATNPTVPLLVNGITYINAAYTSGIGGQLMISHSSTSGSTQAELFLGCDSSGNGYLQGFLQGTGAKNILLNANGGYVGIGLTNPVYTLDVNGGLRSNGTNILAGINLSGTDGTMSIVRTGAGANYASGISFGLTSGSNGASYNNYGYILAGSGGSGGTLTNYLGFICIDVCTGQNSFTSLTSGITTSAIYADTTKVLFNIQGVNKLTILQNSNVGIGTATPSALLNIYSTTADRLGGLTIKTAQAGIALDSTLASGRIFNIWSAQAVESSGAALVFYDNTASAHRMVINSSGYVGIGTHIPSWKLDVVGSGNFTAGNMTGSPTITHWGTGNCLSVTSTYSGTSAGVGIGFNSSSSMGQLFCLAPSQTWHPMSYYASAHYIMGGNVGIGITTPSYALHVSGAIYASGDITALSDQRHKQNITPLADSLVAITQLSGYSYTRSDYKPGEKQIGLIAQEVKEVYPEAVSYDDANDTYSINYGCLMAPVIQALKEMKEKIQSQDIVIQQLLDRLGPVN